MTWSFFSFLISSFNIEFAFPELWVNSGFFVFFLLDFFLNFIFQHLVDLELEFCFSFYEVIMVSLTRSRI